MKIVAVTLSNPLQARSKEFAEKLEREKEISAQLEADLIEAREALSHTSSGMVNALVCACVRAGLRACLQCRLKRV